MGNRWRDGLRQAERDLEAARLAREAGIHEWACFAAQQAAEKAPKALHLARGQEAWGQVVARPLREAAAEVPEELVERARVYVPARYPNGFAEGAPGDHIGALQSGEAVGYAGAIVAFVRARVAEA